MPLRGVSDRREGLAAWVSSGLRRALPAGAYKAAARAPRVKRSARAEEAS